MYLLYADESGTIGDPTQKNFVLAGLAIFETDPHWIEIALDGIAQRFDPNQPNSVELHGSPMRSGTGRWRSFPKLDREQAILDALEQIACNRPKGRIRIFASVLEKQNFAGKDVAQIAFEQISSRFDQFLRRHHLQGNTQRGLIIFDKSSTEKRIQTLAREFKTIGHSYGVTRNYAEVPVFIDSLASRLIQLADLVAYALFRHFEYQDSKYHDVISECFDSDGGVTHGLYRR